MFQHLGWSVHTGPLAYTVSTMTMWKTVLYFLISADLSNGGYYCTDRDFTSKLVYMWLPLAAQTLVPLMIVMILYPLLARPQTEQKKGI